MNNAPKLPSKRSIYGRYWELYGRSPKLFSSGYFLAALILTDLSYSSWRKEGWWDTSISVLPSILGFSLAAFTMLLAFGSDTFLAVLATRPKSGKRSALEGTSAAFFHFLFLQIVALLSALFAKSFYGSQDDLKSVLDFLRISDVYSDALLFLLKRTISAIGVLLFYYSILCALAASARVFSLSLQFRDVVEMEAEKRKPATKETNEDTRPRRDIKEL